MLKWGKNMRYYKRSHVHYSKSAMKIIALVFMLVGVTFLAVGIGFAIHQTHAPGAGRRCVRSSAGRNPPDAA